MVVEKHSKSLASPKSMLTWKLSAALDGFGRSATMLDVPDVILNDILSYLEAEDLSPLLGLCKHLTFLVRQDELWHKCYYQKYKKKIDFQNCSTYDGLNIYHYYYRQLYSEMLRGSMATIELARASYMGSDFSKRTKLCLTSKHSDVLTAGFCDGIVRCFRSRTGQVISEFDSDSAISAVREARMLKERKEKLKLNHGNSLFMFDTKAKCMEDGFDLWSDSTAGEQQQGTLKSKSISIPNTASHLNNLTVSPIVSSLNLHQLHPLSSPDSSVSTSPSSLLSPTLSSSLPSASDSNINSYETRKSKGQLKREAKQKQKAEKRAKRQLKSNKKATTEGNSMKGEEEALSSPSLNQLNHRRESGDTTPLQHQQNLGRRAKRAARRKQLDDEEAERQLISEFDMIINGDGGGDDLNQNSVSSASTSSTCYEDASTNSETTSVDSVDGVGQGQRSSVKGSKSRAHRRWRKHNEAGGSLETAFIAIDQVVFYRKNVVTSVIGFGDFTIGLMHLDVLHQERTDSFELLLPKWLLNSNCTLTCCAFNRVYDKESEDTAIATGHANGFVHFWSLRGKYINSIHTSMEHQVLQLLISDDQQHIINLDSANVINVWDMKLLSKTASVQVEQQVTCISMKAGVIYVGSDQGVLSLYTSTGKLIAKYDAHSSDSISCLALPIRCYPCGSGKQLLCTGGVKDCKIKLWLLNTTLPTSLPFSLFNKRQLPLLDGSKYVYKLLKGHHAPVVQVVIDLHKIVSCSQDGSIKLWSLQAGSLGRIIRTLRWRGGKSAICSLVVSPRVIIASAKNASVCAFVFGESFSRNASKARKAKLRAPPSKVNRKAQLSKYDFDFNFADSFDEYDLQAAYDGAF